MGTDKYYTWKDINTGSTVDVSRLDNGEGHSIPPNRLESKMDWETYFRSCFIRLDNNKEK